ncbi:unnamed protein product [Angiostrongylus costaricensis]|uniref:Titin n=1 Tax=Angiostrongylus costaricensis TaxID=334426 RepID=A0A0R3PFF2_ANGCS|nr:unnamed protein product [Angiostrongylus costaricensis]
MSAKSEEVITEVLNATSGERTPQIGDVLSNLSSRRSSGASGIGSYSISRRKMRKSGFVSAPGPEMFALRGDTIRFECELVNEDDEVEWLINDKPYAAEPRSLEEADGPFRRLTIRDLTPEDTGMIVEVRLNENVVTSKLVVEEILAEITKRLDYKSTGEEGKPVTLTIALDHPAKEVKWYKDNEEITESLKYDIDVKNNFCHLTIKKVDHEDAGQYTVIADGSKSYTNLRILGKPRIKTTEHELVEVERNENIMLNASFDCQEEPTAMCLFNGEVLHEDAKTHLEVHQNTVKFCKRNATKADSGEYTIKLSNEFGEDLETFNVKVKDVPGAPCSISVNEVGSDTISIRWEKSTDDGGAPITGYIIEKKEDGRRAFHKVAQVSGSKTSYVVEELENATSYVLRVSAVNKYGPGEPIETPVVTTATPFMAPQITKPPTITNITDDGCVLTWQKPLEDGGSPIYGYDVYRREDDGEWMKISEDLVFVERYVITGLLPSVNYEFKIEACNEAGLTSNSNLPSETLMITPTLGRPATIPSIPHITITSTDSVSLEWDIPEEETSTEYTVSYKSEKSSIWTEVNCSANSCSIDGLKEGVTYVFKVAARNEAGLGVFSDETPPIKLIPNVPPVITKPIKDATVPKKRTLKLECHANAEPAPEYIWYKDGKEIIPQNVNTEVIFLCSLKTLSIVNEGYMGVLIIHSVDYCDTGSYTCEVVNEHGVMKSTANVNVTDVHCHFESSFSEYTEVIEGKDIELCCILSDEDGVVSWYKDGKILSNNDRIGIVVDGNRRVLKITSVNNTDSGTYRCETSDGRGRTEGELLVNEEEPHISIGPQDDVIKHFGSEIILKCELTKPPHKVLWYKNGKEIWPQTNKYTINTEGCISLLKIQNFDGNDVGEYYAVLSQNEVSAPAHLRLKVVPEIRIQEQLSDEVILNAHSELAFHVEVSAFPVPSVTILHNESRMQNRALVEEYDDIVSVRMKNLTREDCGVLRIIVENDAGVSQKDIRLTVLDVPSEPTNLRARNTTTNSTILSWSYPENTNGAPVTEFIVERKAVDSNRWRSIGRTNANTLTFAAGDLLNKQAYGFRVCAVNSVGEGPPSHPVDVLTFDDEWKEEFIEDLPAITPVLDVPDFSVVDYEEGKVAQVFVGQENGFMPMSDESTDSVKITSTPSVFNGADISGAENGEINKAHSVVGAENGFIPNEESAESGKIVESAIFVEAIPVEKKVSEKKGPKKSMQKKKDKSTLEETKVEGKEEQEITVQEKSEDENSLKEKTKDTHKQPGIIEEKKRDSDSLSTDGAQPQVRGKVEIKDDIELKKVALVLKPKSELVELMFGQSGELMVSSSVEAQFNWTKEGRSLDEGFVVGGTKTQTIVQIPSVTFDTAGVYKCVATDTLGNTATTDITASVRGKPIVELETPLVEVKTGESAKFFANVRGTSEVKCIWKKDEELIKTSKNISTSYRDGIAQLNIKEVDASSNGVYTLVATNKDGEDVANVKLVVKSIPDAPQAPLDVTVVGSACSLLWKPPLNDGNCPVLGYYTEKYDEKTKKWTFVARSTNTNCKTSQYHWSLYIILQEFPGSWSNRLS